MKKFLILAGTLLGTCWAAPVLAAGPDDCSPLPSGYIRDGSGFAVTNCANLLKVNPDGSINTTGTGAGGAFTEANSAAILAALQSATPQAVYPTPNTIGGLLTYSFIAAASTNAANIKATPGQFYGLQCHNHAAYEVTVRLYNNAGTPVPGTTAIVARFSIPAAGNIEVSRPLGVAYSAGIGIAATKLIADSDTTVLVASDVVCNVDYF